VTVVGHQFITLTVYICVQYGEREAPRRTDLLAAAETLYIVTWSFSVTLSYHITATDDRTRPNVKVAGKTEYCRRLLPSINQTQANNVLNCGCQLEILGILRLTKTKEGTNVTNMYSICADHRWRICKIVTTKE